MMIRQELIDLNRLCVCEECGALLRPEDEWKHEDWHNRVWEAISPIDGMDE